MSNSELLNNLYLVLYPNIKYEKYIIRPPSKQVISQSFDFANQLECEIFNSSMLSREQMVSFMKEKGIISETINKDMENIKTVIDNKKVEAYNNRINVKAKDLIKKNIKNLKNALNKTNEELYQFDSFTKEGYIEYHRQIYLIQNSVFIGKKRIIINDSDLVDKIIVFVKDRKMDYDEIRQLAKLEEWKNMWNSSNRNPFKKSATDLTDEQKTLILYTKMYNNALKHPEAPDDGVLEDDDLFDGWMISQNRKSKKEKKDQSLNDRFGNHEFVSLPANNVEEAKQIQELNDDSMRALNIEREKHIKSKGKVRYADLPDVKYDAYMEAQKRGKK